jgi:hypothetical protein
MAESRCAQRFKVSEHKILRPPGAGDFPSGSKTIAHLDFWSNKKIKKSSTGKARLEPLTQFLV